MVAILTAMMTLLDHFLRQCWLLLKTCSAPRALGYNVPLMSVFSFPLSVSVAEDTYSVEEETDVKPTVLPPPAEEDQVEDMKVALDMMQSSSSPSSEATASTGERKGA